MIHHIAATPSEAPNLGDTYTTTTTRECHTPAMSREDGFRTRQPIPAESRTDSVYFPAAC